MRVIQRALPLLIPTRAVPPNSHAADRRCHALVLSPLG